MRVSDCEGFDGDKVIDRNCTLYIPRKRIEIFAPDELVEDIFNTVMIAANTNEPGLISPGSLDGA